MALSTYTAEKNSSSPSVAPSMSPSLNPSALPSALPSVNPSQVPSVSPTSPPTLAPSTVENLAPSTAPTKQSSPIVLFTSNIDLVGVTSPPLDPTSQTALLNVTAGSMNIPVSTVFFLLTLIPAEVRSKLRGQAQEPDFVTAVVQVKIPLSSTVYTDPTQLYDSLVALLASSVESGAYNSQLTSISTLFGATQLVHANVTGVISGAMGVDDYEPGDSKKKLSGGEIAIIASAGFLVLVIIACVYYRSHYMASAKQSDADRETASAEPSRNSTSSYRQPYYGD